jgi:RNA polymerase primary sigma factor
MFDLKTPDTSPIAGTYRLRTAQAKWDRLTVSDYAEIRTLPDLAKVEKSGPSERTDDPMRLYLRAMGSIKLLSRPDEIAIAKRIEAGREAMIAGLCESPLSFQAIIIWRDELNEGKVFLRDIIDLEAKPVVEPQ